MIVTAASSPEVIRSSSRHICDDRDASGPQAKVHLEAVAIPRGGELSTPAQGSLRRSSLKVFRLRADFCVGPWSLVGERGPIEPRNARRIHRRGSVIVAMALE